MCIVSIDTLMKGKTFPEAGADLFDIISPAFDSDDKIILDMKDVDVLPSMFLNPSIGHLIKERGKSVISKFSFRNVTKTQVERIKMYIDKIEVI